MLHSLYRIILLVLTEAVLGLLSQTPFQCNNCKKPPTFTVVFPDRNIKNPPANKVKLPPPLPARQFHLRTQPPHQRSVCLATFRNSTIVNNFTTPIGLLTSVTTTPSPVTATINRINTTLLSSSLSSNNSTEGTQRNHGDRNELAFIVLILVIPVLIFILVYKRAKIFPNLERKKKKTPPVKYSSVRSSAS